MTALHYPPTSFSPPSVCLCSWSQMSTDNPLDQLPHTLLFRVIKAAYHIGVALYSLAHYTQSNTTYSLSHSLPPSLPPSQSSTWSMSSLLWKISSPPPPSWRLGWHRAPSSSSWSVLALSSSKDCRAQELSSSHPPSSTLSSVSHVSWT